MKSLAVALTLSVMLSAGPAFAQAPAGAKPAPPAPAQPAPQAAPAPPPFKDGLKYAYINVQRVAAESREGKTLADKVKALQDQKAKELQDKQKALTAAQQKLEQGGSVLSDAARGQLQTEIDRQTRDIQRFTEDAQQDIQNLAAQLQDEFGRKLNPIIDKVATDKQVDFVFNAAESGLVWAAPGMDLTNEVIKAFDGAPPAATAKPAAK